jgi:hypothetical protein
MKVARTQDLWLYSSVNVNIAHISVQSQPNDRVQQLCVVLLIKRLFWREPDVASEDFSGLLLLRNWIKCNVALKDLKTIYQTVRFTMLVCYVIPRIVQRTVNWQYVTGQIMKLFNVRGELVKWSENVWNLNVHLHKQKQVLVILKYCLVR